MEQLFQIGDHWQIKLGDFMSKGNWCIENDFAAQRELAYYTEDKLGKLCRISELEKQFIEL